MALSPDRRASSRGPFLAKPSLAVAIIRQNLCLGRRAVKRYQRPTGLAPIGPPHSLRSGLLFVSDRLFVSGQASQPTPSLNGPQPSAPSSKSERATETQFPGTELRLICEFRVGAKSLKIHEITGSVVKQDAGLGIAQQARPLGALFLLSLHIRRGQTLGPAGLRPYMRAPRYRQGPGKIALIGVGEPPDHRPD
jgi:hypothetical protein